MQAVLISSLLSWVKSPCGCVGTKRQGGEETRPEKCSPDLMELATPQGCEALHKKTLPLIAVWVLGAFGDGG